MKVLNIKKYSLYDLLLIPKFLDFFSRLKLMVPSRDYFGKTIMVYFYQFKLLICLHSSSQVVSNTLNRLPAKGSSSYFI